MCQVVVLYDYKAQRSDELTLFRGDTVLLLYKDSEAWWMGELPDGQQGFFPSSYVTMAGGCRVMSLLCVSVHDTMPCYGGGGGGGGGCYFI